VAPINPNLFRRYAGNLARRWIRVFYCNRHQFLSQAFGGWRQQGARHLEKQGTNLWMIEVAITVLALPARQRAIGGKRAGREGLRGKRTSL
jgi:hypothetical protein